MSRIAVYVSFIALLASALWLCNGWAQQESTLGLTKAEFKALIDVAEKRARELGYKPENLEREVAKNGDLFRVSYYPRQHFEKGVVTYGGAVNIYLTRNGKIIHIEKMM